MHPRVAAWLLCSLLTVLALVAVGCGRGQPINVDPVVSSEPPPYFEDVTAASGIDFTYRNGQEAGQYTLLETLGGGVALLDYDGDGLLDIFLTGGGSFGGPDGKTIQGRMCKLYRNLGGMRFEDVTAAVGLDRLRFYTHGAAVGDYDRDGWPDLLVTGWGRLALLRNVADAQAPGGRRFVEVTVQAGLTETLWSTSAAWADLDGDGFPDLYVCHYTNWSFERNVACSYYKGQRDVCGPRPFEPLPHALYRNNGDGTFTDVSARAGLFQSDAGKHMKGLGVLAADLDGDGKPDLYVTNDETQNLLYYNRGAWKFEEASLRANVARDDGGKGNGSMGVDAADYDGSDRLSLLVTNFQDELHALYRNRGDGTFTFASKTAGLAALGARFVGWGTGFVDVDGDGAEDVFLAHGHVYYHPPPPAETRQRPGLFRNLRQPGDQPQQVRFADVSDRGGPYFRVPHNARGVAIGDLDNDGRPDLIVSHINEPIVVLRNVAAPMAWLGVELRGKGHRDLVGAVATVEVGERRLMRAVKGGGSYCSSGDRRLLFGLGTLSGSARVTVRWPWGKTQTWDDVPLGRYWRLSEGETRATEFAAPMK